MPKYATELSKMKPKANCSFRPLYHNCWICLFLIKIRSFIFLNEQVVQYNLCHSAAKGMYMYPSHRFPIQWMPLPSGKKVWSSAVSCSCCQKITFPFHSSYHRHDTKVVTLDLPPGLEPEPSRGYLRWFILTSWRRKNFIQPQMNLINVCIVATYYSLCHLPTHIIFLHPW